VAKDKRGWLTPDSAPVGEKVRTIRIPDSPAFIQAVNGALWELVLDYNWQEDGFLTPEQCQDFMKEMFWEYLGSDNMLPKDYVKGLTVRTVNQSATGIVFLAAGECADVTNKHALVNPSEIEIVWDSAARVANTWYKVIFSVLGGSIAPRIESANYTPVEYERFVGWVRTKTDSTNVVRLSSLAFGSERMSLYQDMTPPGLTDSAFIWSNNFVNGVYTTFDMSSYLPPGCTLASLAFQVVAPSAAVTLRTREYGRTHAGTSIVGSVSANSMVTNLTIGQVIRSQRFDLWASAAQASSWLNGWVSSFVYSV